MKKPMKFFSLAMLLVMTTAGAALATPSTQIWIPSTDIQPFLQGHLGIDNYFRASGKGSFGNPRQRDYNIMDVGLTTGVLPFEKVQAEIGFDYLTIANDPNDNHPFSLNAKIGTPEDAFFKYQPAVAVGIFNLGKSQSAGNALLGIMGNAPGVTSGQNIVYGLVARTLPAIGPVPSLGRISVGGYHGAQSALVSPTNQFNGLWSSANDGVMASWDRTMSEISDKLWVGVDYMSGNNVNGAVSFGASWAFAKNVSVILGYSIWKEKALAGNNTFTTQLDINFP